MGWRINHNNLDEVLSVNESAGVRRLNPTYKLHRWIDVSIRGRIYVRSRASLPDNGVLANEEDSVYGPSSSIVARSATSHVYPHIIQLIFSHQLFHRQSL